MQAEKVTTDTENTISEASMEGMIQESIAADSSNKSMIIRSSVENEEQVLSVE